MTARAVGWFADIDDEMLDSRGYFWQPCLTTWREGLVHSFDVWFRTKEECDAYIRDTLAPAGGKVLDDWSVE